MPSSISPPHTAFLSPRLHRRVTPDPPTREPPTREPPTREPPTRDLSIRDLPTPHRPVPCSARLRHARPINSTAQQLPASPVADTPVATRRMDPSLFDYFDLCSLGLLHTTSASETRPTPHLPVMAKLSTAFNGLSARLKGWLPRRLHEPTGPWGLMLDMLLSLFVAQGACRTVIEALPLEVVGDHEECLKGDLESLGVAIPVRQGDKCAICLGCYEEGDAVRHLGCNHAFHAECVDVWLERKSLCPICKTDTY